MGEKPTVKSSGQFDKGDRARIGYMPNGRPLLVVAWDTATIVKSYSLAFGLQGELSIRIIFKDNSTSDFSVAVEQQAELYELLIRHMGFTVAVVPRVGPMEEATHEKGMACIGKPMDIDFTPTQLESLKATFAVYKDNH